MRFFGYGSLVNARTHVYPGLAPARLTGWRRQWRHRADGPDRFATALTVHRAPGSEIAGATALVPDADFAALDQRERGYDRVPVHPAEIVPSGEDIVVYRTQPELDRPADRAHPICLSYVDTVIQGFLAVYGRAGVDAFMATTDGWQAILDDRAAPIYPRATALTAEERALVDTVLAPHAAERFSA